MIKKTLKLTLSALLLGAGVMAFAQNQANVIQLGNNGGTTTWKDFAEVINGTAKPTVEVGDTAAWSKVKLELDTLNAAQKAFDDQQLKVDAAQEDYDTENGKIKGLEDALARVQPQTRIPKYSDYDWFNSQRSDYNKVLDYVTNGTGSEPNITYFLTAGLIKALYLSFDGETPVYPVKTVNAENIVTAEWKTVTISEFYTSVIESTTKVSSVKVFMGFAEGSTSDAPKYNYTVGTYGYMSVSGFTSSEKEGMFDAIATTFETMAMQDASATPVPTQAYITAQTNLENQEKVVAAKLATLNAEKKTLATLQKALDNANADVETAKAAYKKQMDDIATAQSNALTAYQNVTLTGNVVADTPITAADFKGTIDGAGYVITTTSQTALFKKFTGQLSNAAVNGTFAGSLVGATFDNVAFWDGSEGRFYNEKGTETDYTTIGSLGFAARKKFGVDFTDKGLLTKLTTESKVYSLSVYNGPNNTPQQNFVVWNSEKNSMTGQTPTGAIGAVTIPTNNFAKSATDDVPAIPNVYYTAQGGNNICAKVVINGDKVNKEPIPNFYCPEDITATELTYNRTFNEGMNSVCLPFVLTKTDKIDALCTYDRETEQGFVFTYVQDEVAANTPMLMKPTAAMNGMELSNVQLNRTNSTQITEATGNEQTKSACFGTFKRITSGQFAGGSTANSVWGLNKGEFQLAGTTATFSPFRIGIVSYANPSNAPRRIIIKNEEGTDITDIIMGGGESGVNDLQETAAFSVEGGQGEIVITSDADFGNAAVYTIDGKVVATANVVAGTNTIDVQKGLYIVMGQKVMVK